MVLWFLSLLPHYIGLRYASATYDRTSVALTRDLCQNGLFCHRIFFTIWYSSIIVTFPVLRPYSSCRNWYGFTLAGQ